MPATAEKITVQVWTCRFCRHNWIPRVASPKACPMCQRRNP